MLHALDQLHDSPSESSAVFAGEFQLEGWDVLVLKGPAKLLEHVDYLSFTGDFGFRFPHVLPVREVIAEHIASTRKLLGHFNANLLNFEFILPGIGSSKKIDKIAEFEAFAGANGDRSPGDCADGENRASRCTKWYLYLEALMTEVIATTPFESVSLANNHALDYGPQGVRYNQKRLERVGAACFGTAHTPFVRLPRMSGEVVVFSMTDLIDRPDVENLIAKLDDAAIAAAEQPIKKADFAAAFVHVIANRSVYPSPYELGVADKLADAGFDLIVCTGSHWPKGYAVRKGVPVFFGTGNYLFSYDKGFTEHQGLHVVAGLRHGRLEQLFIVPFNNHFKTANCGPLAAAELGEFKRRFKDRSAFSRLKYWRDERNLSKLGAIFRKTGLTRLMHFY